MLNMVAEPHAYWIPKTTTRMRPFFPKIWREFDTPLLSTCGLVVLITTHHKSRESTLQQINNSTMSAHPFIFFIGLLLMILPFVMLSTKRNAIPEDDENEMLRELKILRRENTELRKHVLMMQMDKQRSEFQCSVMLQELNHMTALVELFQSEWKQINDQMLHLRKEYTDLLVKRRNELLLQDADHFALINIWQHLQIETKRVAEWQARAQSLQTQGCYIDKK